MRSRWTLKDVPSLKGRRAIVTGGSAGIGFEVAAQLARCGAQVILASRDETRVERAVQTLQTMQPDASIEADGLDLASLNSVRDFATRFLERYDRLDLLINNAGVFGGPRRTTEDGYEAHFQINYLGHFALTGHLIPALLPRSGSRVVSISSDVAARGKVDFDDLQVSSDYGFIKAYSQSKLATLLFAVELERRLRAVGAATTSLATHPGNVETGILVGKEATWGRPRRGLESVVRLAQRLIGQPPSKGALSVLYQATEPSATSDEYVIGTAWPSRGYPRLGKLPVAAKDRVAAARLWETSTALTGVRFAV